MEFQVKPFISVIVPAFNAEAHIGGLIDNVLQQSFENVELIVVDDCSSDNTKAIVEQAMTDPRVKLVVHDENEGPLAARMDGIDAANGDYALFLDADDALTSDACARIAGIANEIKYDIIHFNMNVINVSFAPDSDIKATEAFARPLGEELHGRDVLVECFANQRYGWNLANKAIKLDVCRRAQGKLPRIRLLRGEDALAYFFYAYYAQSYVGAPDEYLYNYYYGSGEDGKVQITMDEFRHMCSSKEVADVIRGFLESEGVLSDYWECYESTAMNLASHAARQYRLRVPSGDKASAFDYCQSVWGPLNTAVAFSRQYWNAPESFARFVRDSEVFSRLGRKVKTIGTYYHHYLGGGTEKVQQFLIGLWKRMGYRVVAFVDNLPAAADIDIADEADAYYLLPEAVKCTAASYAERAKALEQAVYCSEVDLMVYHYYDSKTLAWDMTLLKCSNIPVLVYYHNSFSYLEKFGRPQFAELSDVYALADGLITLSAVDTMWWTTCGSHCFETVSPYIYKNRFVPSATVKNKNILCLGRVAPDKHTEEVIDIFEIVVRNVPDATLTIVGGSGDRQYVSMIKDKVSSSRYSNSITMIDWAENVSRYFSNARVFLMASDIEGYPLALLESLASGVPAVMYDLPYLTLTRCAEGMGVVSVPYGEKNRAADEVVRFLQDDEYRDKMSMQAKDVARPFVDYDFVAFWDSLIHEMENPSVRVPELSEEEQTRRIMMQVLFDTYKKDLQSKRERIDRLEKEKSKLVAERVRVKKSNSWRVGRLATWAPRKVKKILKSHKTKED